VHRAVLGLQADVVFAATGTPLENGLTDLWSILSLTSPGLFPSARRFREEYVKPIEHGRVDENAEGGVARERRLVRLRRRVQPFLLRRTKDVVAADLPPRQEQDVRVELSSGHRAVYERVLQRERRKVLGLLDDLDSQRFIVFRSLTLLRMLALAPALVDAGGPGIVPSKLDALRGRLDEVVAEGHRALVFSQFTSFLDIVEDDLRAHGVGVVRLDGSTTRRADVVEAFRRGDDPVFLISLKAGGVGLTLTEADYVFLLDPWWNPAAEQQAIDRTHRIGQDRPVTVYRLIAAGTIEEKVVELQRRKARLISAVLDADGAFSNALTADDIRQLLA
jgi:SNF2 family DNA or RNA helicase